MAAGFSWRLPRFSMPPAALAMNTRGRWHDPRGAEVKFALDVEAFFDEKTLDDASGGTGLRSDQFHAENEAPISAAHRRNAPASRRLLCPAARVDLGFHDGDVRLQALRRFAHFFLVKATSPRGVVTP